MSEINDREEQSRRTAARTHRRNRRNRRRTMALASVSVTCLGVGAIVATVLAVASNQFHLPDGVAANNSANSSESIPAVEAGTAANNTDTQPQVSAPNNPPQPDESPSDNSQSSDPSNHAKVDGDSTETEASNVAASNPSAALAPLAYQPSVERFLDRLQTLGYARQEQAALFVSLDGVELAQHQANLELPAASITKLATSLAAIELLGPDRRFTTRIYTTGEVRDRVLYGDIYIVGGGDPYFVWEDSFAVASQIARLGIRHVTGDLNVVGSFYMNYDKDRSRSAEMLRWGMHESLWPDRAERQFANWAEQHASAPTPNLSFSGDILTGSVDVANALPDDAALLIEHQSAPLTTILKVLNSYSSNAIADILAEHMGGVSEIEAVVAPMLPSGEMQLETASGLGRGNQFSSRAVVELLTALDDQAAEAGLQLEDWLPLMGEDPGTLEERTAPTGTTAKSGTLDGVATLAGLLPNRTYFVLLNQGWDIAAIRDRQDSLLHEVIQVSVDLDS